MFMMCISFVSPTQAIATLTSTVALLFVMLFGGFLVNQDTIPEALRWIRYISVFHYGYEVRASQSIFALGRSCAVPLSGPAGDTYQRAGWADYQHCAEKSRLPDPCAGRVPHRDAGHGRRPVGQRSLHTMRLHQQLFHPRLHCASDLPKGEKVAATP